MGSIGPARSRASGCLELGELWTVAGIAHIVCIHDANTFIQPESYSRAFGLTYRMLLPVLGKRASRIATVSQFPPACSSNMASRARRRSSSRPTVMSTFYVGTRPAHEHRFWIRLSVHTFCFWEVPKAQERRRNSQTSASPGRSRARYRRRWRWLRHFRRRGATVARSNLHHVGFISDDDLAALYQRAVCLAFPSLTEGFGIPPLEARRSDVPSYPRTRQV